MGKFINPFTDWGFKHIFGREASKDVLIEFLNDLLQGERVITDVQFMNSERLPEHFEYRKVIYDIYCQTDTGEHIIVEMQNRRQDHFKERGLYYLSKAIAIKVSREIGISNRMPFMACFSPTSIWTAKKKASSGRMWH